MCHILFSKLKKRYCILIILAAPLYVIFNNICLNVFNLAVNGHVNTLWHGFYCSLKKQEYSMNSNLTVVALGFMILRLALFALAFIKGTYQAAIQKALLMVLTLDLIGIILYAAFYVDLSDLFKLYFSFSPLFLASGNKFGTPFCLPALLMLGEGVILYGSESKMLLPKSILFLVLSFLSVVFWYGLRLMVV